MSTLPEGQRMARVQADEADWNEFQELARSKRRSIAAYLGHLVRKEIGRAERAADRSAKRRTATSGSEQVGDDEPWLPQWEI
jgi:hypothetical protein